MSDIQLHTIEQRLAVPTYHFSGIPQIESVNFTNGSSDSRILPRAVEFAAGPKGQVLWSAQEVVAFRYAALIAGQDGLDNANKYQWTRTASIYFKTAEGWHVAFDDIPGARKNIVLAKAQEGYDSHKARGKFPLLMRNELVKAALKRAEKDDRIIAVPESRLELLTKPTDGQNSVAGNLHSNVILGYSSALQAEFLSKKGYEKGYFYFLTLSDLEKMNLGKNQVEIRVVGLGDDDFDISSLDAINRFSSYGRAAGVVGAKKFQWK